MCINEGDKAVEKRICGDFRHTSKCEDTTRILLNAQMNVGGWGGGGSTTQPSPMILDLDISANDHLKFQLWSTDANVLYVGLDLGQPRG